MKNVFVIWACLAVMMMACSKPEEKAPDPVAETKPPQAEFADAKYAEMGQKKKYRRPVRHGRGYLADFLFR